MTIDLLLKFGTFNDWKGCVDLYFTRKEVREVRKYGITGETNIKEAYNILKRIKK